MERFLPSPFNVPNQETNNDPVEVLVENSLLVCVYCLEEVTNGTYNTRTEILKFTCSQGHLNEVGIKL